MRDINRGTPGDQAIYSESKTPEQKKLGKRKSQHFNDAFAYRESNSSARERVERESMVIAEIRTNVIVYGDLPLLKVYSLTDGRSKMNTRLLPISPIVSLAVTKDQNRQYSSQSRTLLACYSVAPLIQHIP